MHSDIVRIKLSKLRLLAHELGISLEEERGALRLAIKLAETFVAGFSVVESIPRSGRTQRWTYAERAHLVCRIEAQCRVHGVKPYRACRQLTKTGEVYERDSHETLYRQYNLSRSMVEKLS
jgi:hypothetical protein